MTLQAPAKPEEQAPRISVVMAAYNGARFLRAQMDSILAQSCADFELIVVDDVSGDGSYGILEEYARRDARIVLSRNARNLGLLENLARLFGRARAPWIAISDHDDVWHPRKLEKLLACAGDGAAAYCNSELIDSRGETLGLTIMEAIGVQTPASGDVPLKLLWKNCVSGHAMIFRRELCEGFLPFSGTMPYDQQIAILAMANGGLAYCPEKLIQHRLHDANFCNHSLLYQPLRDMRRRTPTEKLERRRQHRKKLADRIAYFERKKLIPAAWRRVVNSDRLDRKWFDLGLFMFVLRHPDLFTQRERHRRLRVAFKFAKGAAWYRTVHAWRLLLSGSARGGQG
jgi:glycosyltransferase involved in cell wall biosynthesis